MTLRADMPSRRSIQMPISAWKSEWMVPMSRSSPGARRSIPSLLVRACLADRLDSVRLCRTIRSSDTAPSRSTTCSSTDCRRESGHVTSPTIVALRRTCSMASRTSPAGCIPLPTRPSTRRCAGTSAWNGGGSSRPRYRPESRNLASLKTISRISSIRCRSSWDVEFC